MIYICILIIAFNCTCCTFTKNTEKSSETLVHHNIDIKNEMIWKGGFILASKNGLIGFEESQSLPAFYYFNNNDKDSLFRFINKGQGPNEVLHPMNLQYINEDTLGVFDIMNMSYYHIPIEKNMEFINLNERVHFENRFYHILKTAQNQYIGLSGENHLFVLLDSKGKIIKSFFEYPYKDKNEREINNSIRSLAYQGSIMANPSSTKCIYAPYNGDIIHFYDIKRNDITLVRKLEKNYPDYIVNEGNSAIKKSTIRGYVSIATTDSFVYALYCGKTLNKLLNEKNKDTMEGNILRIFDWNGYIKREINLDIPCKHIAVSHDDKTVWAIAAKPDIQLFKFNIKENEGENKYKATKNYNISKHSLFGDIQNKKPSNTTKNNLYKELEKINLKNIHKSQTDSFFLVIEEPNLKLISTEKTCNDINIIAKYGKKRTIVHFFIKKDKIGLFSDSIILKFSNKTYRFINIYGKVY